MAYSITLVEALAPLAIGVASGAVGGLLGVTPGGVLVPLLSLVLGLSQLQTQGISLAAQVLPTSLAGFREFNQAGHSASLKAVVAISLGFLLGSYLGAQGAHHVADCMLRWMFIAYLLVLAGVIALKPSSPSSDASQPPEAPPASVLALGIVGTVAGASSGFLGIGGGLAMIALLTVWLSFSQHRAQALSLAVNALPLTLPAVLIYADTGAALPWPTVAWVVVGLWIGTACGAKIAVRLSQKMLRSSFLVLILVMAGAMAAQQISMIAVDKTSSP